MGDDTSLFNLLFLGGALLLVLLTGLTGAGVGRRSRAIKPAEGQRTATIGMLIWLGLLGLACYLIFG